MKKSMILMSQNIDSFAPNAESTKIINNNLSETKNDEDTQIIKELSLEEIDFEEPIISKENENKKIKCSENNEEENIDIVEYHKKIRNIGIAVPLQTIQSDNSNVLNFNTEKISISQWSKGDVVLNGKPLEVFLMLTFSFIILIEIYNFFILLSG